MAPRDRELPATTVIEPRSGWAGVNVRELLDFHELLYFFVWRDLKVRYRQTVFGALWALIQPLALMIVFTLFLGRIEGVAPPGVPYPLFAFAGLVPWTLFAQSLIGASDSLVSASNLLQKVYFPRLLLPVAATGSFLVDYAIGMVLLVVMTAAFGAFAGLQFLWVLPLTLLALGTALAVGIWFAAINVRYRDVRYAVPFVVQLWLLASPVAYTAELIPEAWQWLYSLNPMVGVIEGVRWAVLGGDAPPVAAVLLSCLVTIMVAIAGVSYFRRVERTFADVI